MAGFLKVLKAILVYLYSLSAVTTKTTLADSSMLTRTTMKYLTHAATTGSSVGALPFAWSTVSRHPLTVTDRNLRKFVINCTSQLVMIVYLVFRTIQYYVNMSPNTVPKVFLLFSVTASLVFCHILSLNVLCQRDGFKEFTNTWFSYFLYVHETYALDKKDVKHELRNGCEKQMRILAWSSFFCTTMVTAHYLEYPNNPIYVTSLFERGSLAQEMIYLPHGIFICFFTYQQFLTMKCLGYLVTIPVYVLHSLNSEMKPHFTKTPYLTKDSLREPETLVNEYRFIYLLSTMTTNLFSVVGLPCHYLSSYTVIACTVCLLNYSERLGWKMAMVLSTGGLLLFVGWTSMLWLAALLLRNSLSILSSWKAFKTPSGTKHRRMQKMRVSCMPMKVGFGGLYYITVRKIMQYVNFLIWGTVRSMLMLNSH